jgi:hypothetical protein
MPAEDRRGLPNATSASCILLFLARISEEDLRLTRSKILAGPPQSRSDARHERPHDRAAEKRDELAPLHSITWSASASSRSGTSRPSALAATTLMTSSYLVGISTGKSPGFVPLRMDAT